MRVLKKISTPFVESSPDRAIIVVNAIDPQINTIKSFIDACDMHGISYTVFVNKTDSKEKSNPDDIRDRLGLKTIRHGSAKTGEGIDELSNYIDLWEGKRIILLGVFNSGKTSIINQLCNTNYEVGDIPGTTLEFNETTLPSGTVLIDSVGQLIDIHKPLMISIDYVGCKTVSDRISKTFDEEILGLVKTKEGIMKDEKFSQVISVVTKALESGKKIVTLGAGASALVALEMAGQGTECGLKVLPFTNNGAQIQPITFSVGLGEDEGRISEYISTFVDEGDIVIGISASGGTGFVFDTLEKSRSLGAVTIAITENADTPVGRYADYILKSDAKPEGPSSSKIQTAHLVIGHALILGIADTMGISADDSIGYMLSKKLQNKKMGIK